MDDRPAWLQDGARIVFLGDSITYDGRYVAYFEALLRIRYPKAKFEVLNLGLPSETASGLSEPDHPFPRPCIHERLERVLKKTKPSVVFACYGMNDGIYAPFSEERFKAYQDGMRKLVQKCRQVGAEVILLTPPPFDAAPVLAQTVGVAATNHGWQHPFREYDGVLERYREWLVSSKLPVLKVINTGEAIKRELFAWRRKDSRASFAADGVHLNADGHRLIYAAVAAALVPVLPIIEIEDRKQPVTQSHLAEASVSGQGMELVVESPAACVHDDEWRASQVSIPGDQSFYPASIRVTACKSRRYSIYLNGVRSVAFESEGEGIGFSVGPLAMLVSNRSELVCLVREKMSLLRDSWLANCGHKRPGMSPGTPLSEARIQARGIDDKIRRVIEPKLVRFTIVAID